jgi:hypothetical protein
MWDLSTSITGLDGIGLALHGVRRFKRGMFAALQLGNEKLWEIIMS